MRHGADGQRPGRGAARSPCAAPSTTRNLFVVDGGFLPTSAAVNPALTIAAQALRVADHIRSDGSRGMTPARRHRHRRRRGIGLAIAQSLAEAGFDIAADLDRLGSRQGRDRSRDFARHGADVLFHEGDLADLDGHAPLVDSRRSSGSAASTAWSTMPASPRRCAAICSIFSRRISTQVMSVNLRGTVFFTQAVAKAMLAGTPTAEPRTIVNITSVSAEMASPERADYCISKAGLSHVDARRWRCGSPTTASPCSRSGPASSAPT